MAKEIELRRHTDADEDVLTPAGVEAALAIGTHLRGGYQLAVSSGAQRATQTLACFLAALGQQIAGGVLVEPGLRSRFEDRWRAAYQKVGSGELAALREADPELVTDDSQRLGAAPTSPRATVRRRPGPRRRPQPNQRSRHPRPHRPARAATGQGGRHPRSHQPRRLRN